MYCMHASTDFVKDFIVQIKCWQQLGTQVYANLPALLIFPFHLISLISQYGFRFLFLSFSCLISLSYLISFLWGKSSDVGCKKNTPFLLVLEHCQMKHHIVHVGALIPSLFQRKWKSSKNSIFRRGVRKQGLCTWRPVEMKRDQMYSAFFFEIDIASQK